MLQVRVEQQKFLTKLVLSGPVDDEAGPLLSGLLPEIKNKVVIDFAEVEYFNSLGIRTWVNFLHILLEGRAVVYENCPMEFVQQISMMPALSQGVEVKSFSTEFACKDCGHEQKIGFTSSQGKESLIQQIEGQNCERCGSRLELEDDIDSLLIFLKN